MDDLLEAVLRLPARLLMQVFPAVQAMNLANASNQVNQSVEVLDLKAFDDALRPVLESLFKFLCLRFKPLPYLLELVGIVRLYFADPLLQHFVEVGLPAVPRFLLGADQGSQLIAHVDRGHSIEVQTQVLNELECF